MITLSRLNGQVFALNGDLIERVDATPDTVVTLVDGTRYVVAEPVPEVVRRVVEFRAAVVARSQQLTEPSPVRELRAVPDLDGED
jgi:flagellar protein FlbD